MPSVEYQTLVDAAYDADLDESAVRNYSGRNMYGRECFGLVVDTLGDAFTFILALAERDEHVGDWVRDAREDSMGLGSIVVYWPYVVILDHPDDA